MGIVGRGNINDGETDIMNQNQSLRLDGRV